MMRRTSFLLVGRSWRLRDVEDRLLTLDNVDVVQQVVFVEDGECVF